MHAEQSNTLAQIYNPSLCHVATLPSVVTKQTAREA